MVIVGIGYHGVEGQLFPIHHDSFHRVPPAYDRLDPGSLVGQGPSYWLYTTYSANNGNFYLPASAGTIADWSEVEIRARTDGGEIEKPSAAPREAGCNGCHAGGSALGSP